MRDELTIPEDRDLPAARRRELRAHLLSELRYLRRRREPWWRSRRLLAGATAAVLLLVGVGAYSWWTTPRPVTVVEGSFAWHFTQPRYLAATAPLIVLGTVERVERGRSWDHGDEVETDRRLVVRVERYLAGTPAGDRLVLQDVGWVTVDGGREAPLRVQGMLRLEQGDRAVLFLRRDPSTGLWEQLNGQAAYLVEGSRILPTTRTDPMVGRIEAMTLPELERLIAEDRAEVARGELEPVPRGSTR